ncbi:TniQ family protein [Variovorax sp. dw_954]|uniref:TniQ family protein n=1 Tax=Variovorax sp. dw_954 TaxID=2720078 RepID=UPI001BD24352|nr:TniQ family protein [Variovorax sp. dw_954]
MTRRNALKAIRWLRPLTPHPDESLAGFLGRWARENEFGSRTNLLNTLGISRAIRLPAVELPKLASLLGLDVTALESMAPTTDPTRTVLRKSHTRPDTEAVCPQCLSEASYSRQLWSHCHSTACPEHATRLRDHCQQCGDGIRHTRPLPHLCNCGADLRAQTSEPASQAEVDFSALLMGEQPKGTSIPLFLDAGVPAEIDLYIWGLANHFACASDGKPFAKAGKLPLPKSVAQAVDRLGPLFELLEDWPHRFDARLKQIMEAAPTAAATGVAAKHGRWYFFLFRTYPQDAFHPVRVAAANRITASHDGLLNARTHSIQNIATVQKRWFSVKEASVELRVSTERINEGIDRYVISASVHDEAMSYRQRFLSREEIQRLKQLQFEHVNDTDARAILNVPKSVYNLMCEAGWITRSDPNDTAPVVSGYVQHVPLLRLIERLRKLAQENKDRKIVASIPLRELSFRRTTNMPRLIGLFRAIAAGELTPVDHDEHLSIGGLMFAQDEVDQRIASWFVERGLTLQQVSAMMGAHYDAVKSWVDMGFLPASREPMEQGAPWVVDVRDMVTFLQTYSPLAWQAKSCSSSTRGLTSRLESLGVTPIASEDVGRGQLVKLSDVFTALKAVHQSRGSYSGQGVTNTP